MKALLLFTFFLLSGISYSQQNVNYQPPIAGFHYVEQVNKKAADALPLLIAFHYSSGTPGETLKDYDQINTPFRLIIPRGNYRKRNGFSYYPVDYYKNDSATQFRLSKITADSIATFVRAIEEKYQQKAVVSGISQGGDLALLLAIYHPDLCIAAFPFAAVINPSVVNDVKQRKISASPVHLYQGEADEIVSVAYTRKKISALGPNVQIKLSTYPGVGHEISPEMKRDYSLAIEKLFKKTD